MLTGVTVCHLSLQLDVGCVMTDRRSVVQVKAWMTTVSRGGPFSPNPFTGSTCFHQDSGPPLVHGSPPETRSLWACKVTARCYTGQFLWHGVPCLFNVVLVVFTPLRKWYSQIARASSSSGSGMAWEANNCMFPKFSELCDGTSLIHGNYTLHLTRLYWQQSYCQIVHGSFRCPLQVVL